MRPAKTALVVFGSSQLGTIVGFIATLYIARYFGSATLGMYAVVTALLFWIHVPASAIDSALTKRVSEGIDQGQFLFAGFAMNLALALLVALGMIVFDGQVNAYVGSSVSGTVAVFVLSWFGAKSVIAALHGQDKVAVSSLVWTSSRVVRTGLQISLTLLVGLGLAGLIWGHTISFVVVILAGITLFDIRPRIPSREKFWSLLEYARYSWIGDISSQAFNWMDTILLGLFVSSSLIGIYEVSWTIASTLGIISTAIKNAVFPSMSRLDAQDRREEVQEFLNEGLVFAGFFSIPGLLGGTVIGSRVLEIFGPEFGQGWLILLILITARLSNSFSSQFRNTLQAVDRPDLAFRSNTIFISANLILNFSLIPTIGWVGAAIATSLSSIIMLVITYNYVSGVLSKVVVPVREIGKEIFASLIMVAPVYVLAQAIPANPITTVGIVFAGAAVYGVVILGISPRIRSHLMSLLPQSMAKFAGRAP
jgi:O-antigen/teichoic acid export membrane protein